MTLRRIRALEAMLVLALFALTFWVYPQLPEQMPIHWRVSGEVDDLAPRWWAAFILPCLTAAIAALFTVLPRISPRRYALDPFARTFHRISAFLVAFMAFLHVVLLSHALGAPIAVERWILGAVGLLIAVLGNFFGKTTRNFFVGIRTPWTLASDEVWLRTHRLGGKLFVVAGVLILLSALVGRGAWLIPVAPISLIAATAIPVAYSYWLYRRLEGFDAQV